jgi:drug/metabolite transporter (DMT)-like permease
VLLGTFLLGERLSLALAIGLTAAVLGVALINWPLRECA